MLCTRVVLCYVILKVSDIKKKYKTYESFSCMEEADESGTSKKVILMSNSLQSFNTVCSQGFANIQVMFVFFVVCLSATCMF